MIDFGWPLEVPRAAQDRPKTPQGRPKTPQDRPEIAQDRPKPAQDRSKLAQDRPRSLQDQVVIETGVEKGVEEESKPGNSRLFGYDQGDEAGSQ